ncbi:MAG: MBG domain-containing protein [Terracidiphilus sp.]
MRSLPGTSQWGLAPVCGAVSFVAALLLTATVGAFAQAPVLQPGWNQLSPANPPQERYIHAMTYDAGHGQVVLFGGFGQVSPYYLNDTWLWKGSSWTQANPAVSPDPRAAHALVYDAAHNKVVLFGGTSSSTNRFGDTWTWDGTNWTNVTPSNPANSPSPRDATVMVYDATNHNVVLFGGSGSGNLGDTWTWDGTNWTQLSPGSSPSARADYSMVYDVAHGQVVLFGGSDNTGFRNDTWTWNGTTWTQLSPGTSPPARDTQGMAYDAALGEVIMWGGEGSGGFLNDTWAWDGSNWTQLTSPTTPPVGRYAPNAVVYDSAQNQLLLFSGQNASQVFDDTWTFAPTQNFGSINVCPSGQSTPTPCSSTLTLTYNVGSARTLQPAPTVVTQGAAGLDFTLATGSTCSGTLSAATCTVNVTFTPKAPGLRTGAVELFDYLGNLLVTTPIYGVGQGPEIVYGPALSGTTILGGPSLENVLATPGFTPNPRGMATDAAGNLYISDPSNGRLLMRTKNGTTTTVGTLSSPQGVAIDGAGNLFVADTGLQEVVEIPAGCANVACQVPVYNPPSADPVAVVVDGLGDLFVAAPSAGGVVEVPAGCTSSSCWIPIGSGWHSVNTLAIDAAGDLFVPDSSAGFVSEMPAGCTTNSCWIAVGPGWIAPRGIAVDAAGDLFVSDNTAAGGMGQLTEVPAGCSSSTCEIALVTGIFAYDLAVDQLGQVYVGDGGNHRILQINQSLVPVEDFATTNVGSSSTDSPQSLTILNAGNQTLSAAGPGLVTTGPNFLKVAGTGTPADCTASFSLAPGAGCNLSISFEPQFGGNLVSTSTLTDNNLNASPATQTIALSGSAFEPAEPLNLTGAGTGSGYVSSSPSGVSCNVIAGVVSPASGGSCSPSYPGGTGISLQEIPTSGSTFTGWGGACASQGTSQACNITTNIGSPTDVSASFSPVATSFALTVTEVGTGSGTVSDDLSQINCMRANGSTSGSCSGSYAGSVSLTSTATGNSIFAGWGGACASSGASPTCSVTVNTALNVTASFVAPGPTQPGLMKPITAGVVYGQGGSFTSGTADNGGISANSLQAIDGVVVDANGNLFVADGQNNRVLFYPSGSTIATRVYGQSGSFTSGTANNGGINANSLNNPQGLALDSSGNLYVADQYNNRVLFYPAGSTTATKVYGQNGSFTTNTANNGGVSANGLYEPFGLAVDSSSNLYISDYQNNRVLFYPAGSTTATQVYGQGGSFTSVNLNNGGLGANSLNQPTGVALDSSGDLYVCDIFNNRVLFYPYGSTTATQVYGQPGFTTNFANNGGVSANSLNNPMYATVDSSGDLYVTDRSNNRVLFYPFGSTTATRVYGQANDFTASSSNNGGIGANSLWAPFGLALDNGGNLYVTDYANNRVLEYGSFGNVNVCPAGQITPAPCKTTITLSYYAPAPTTLGAAQVVTQGATGLDFALAGGDTCTGVISAGSSCTVNATFTPLAPGLRSGAVTLYDSTGAQVASSHIYGIGQAPLAVFGPGTQITLPATGLNGVSGVAVDAAGNVFISENAGAVKISPSGVQTAVPTTGISLAYDVAVDGAGNVFLADLGGNKVVKVTPGGVQTTVPAIGLLNPTGVAVDGSGDVFITDRDNNRVVEVTPSGVQTTVPASGVDHPYYPAVDAAGDVFFLNSGTGQVLKVTAGGIQSTIPTGGLGAGNGVAVDAAGDVFVSDQINNVVLEVSPNGVESTVPTNGLNIPAGLAVDALGDIFIAVNGQTRVVEVNRSQVPSLAFALTNVGSTSTDSPQIATLQNVGNQPLSGTATFNSGTSFSMLSTCGPTLSLLPGSSCSLNFGFSPQSTGYLTGSAVFSDNTMNLSPAVSLQTISLSGIGGLNGQSVTAAVPNVVGFTQPTASSTLTGAGLVTGSVSTAASSIVPSGSVIASNPAAGTQVALGSSVKLLISSGAGQPPAPNPLSLLDNYFVTGDYAAAGVTLRAAPVVNNVVTGTISIPASTGPNTPGVPTGADLIDGFLYWTTIESSATPSGANAIFLGYPIAGQQIGSDLPYTDTVASVTGTLRVYRANVNTYFQNGANGIRAGSGSFTVSLPAGGANGVSLTEGASLVIIYRVLSPNFPLKAVVIYDGSAIPPSSTTQNIQGFYDAAGGGNISGEVTTLFVDSTGWNNAFSNPALGHPDHYDAPLNAGAAYGAVILSALVNNPDNDGILGAWKAGPSGNDFHSGEPGYYDVKTGAWVGLPGAKAGHKDLFVQLDYMCGGILSDGSCDPNKENLFPSPDSQGNDPLAMVQQAFANAGVALHLQIGNAVPESTCVDSPGQPCQFPGEPGVVGWKNSLEFSKVWPRNFASCAAGSDCSPRFPYGQKDSYHYVLFGHSLAIPAWNTRYQTLTSINAVANGTTTIVTTDRGAQGTINYCPSRITVSGIQGMPSLNGVYDTSSCPDSRIIVIPTPSSVTTNWSYPNNTLPEPVIGITSGTVTSISGYSDLGGADSAVTLGLWETSLTQDMSKKATVLAGTLFHELGHTIGLSHGGLYYDTAGSYVPTFEANCKPNYQSIMNYLFQLDGVGPTSAVAFSNQTLTMLTQSSFGSITTLLDTDPGFVGNAATFPTSSWYTPTAPSPTASSATLHCDGAPLGGDVGYRVNGSIAPITPAWSNGQNITFDGQSYSTLRGFNDLSNIDLRQVGATGGQFASLASVLAFGSSTTPLNIAPGGSVSVGPGGTVTLGAGGSITVPGGNVTMPTGGTISGGGTITLGGGGNVTLGAGGNTILTAGSNGIIALPAGGNVTLGGGGTITLGGGGNVTLGAGGTVTLGAGGTITLPAGGGTVTIPSTGGSYFVPAGGTVTLGGGGNITLGAGGNVTLGAGGNVTLGAGGNVTLGGGGNVTLGAGGTVTLGGGGTVTLNGGGNITLGGGGTITLGGGGNVTLGGGGNVTLGAGGTVTLGAGGNITLGGGGNVTLGAGGTVTLGAGGNITLGGGGTVTLGGGGNVTLGAGGNITGGGTITMNSPGTVTLGAGGGTINGTQDGPGIYPVSAGGTVTLGAGGNITLDGGGNVTLGGGGNVTLGAGGNITLGGGGTVTLGGGGNVTLGAGGVVTLGGGGNVTLGAGGNVTLGGGGNVTLGGGGAASTELDYSTANSIVRPPTAPTETSTTQGVVVNWTAPGFGVVDTYTIYRSVNGGTPVVIGSVSGVGGNPPATTFTDTNPPLSGTVVYTITTTLAPDPGTATQRQSGPSSPAVMTVDQTIVLAPLPSSVPLSSSTLPVSATAGVLSNGTLTPNHQLVSFAATGSCSVGASSLDTSQVVSSATVTLNGTGSCTITASQPGDSTTIPAPAPAYNAADPVSGTFMIVPQGSNLTAQTITFPQLPNAQYGNSPVSVSATASPSGFTVTFTASGPCTMTGADKIAITGAGKCSVTAMAPSGVGSDNKTYSAASATQLFNIAPAVLTVKAGNLTIAYGQSIPSLTNDYTITGYVNSDTSSVLNNTAPALSTTATSASNPGSYPITVSTGTLAATNYDFLYVNGTLTVTYTGSVPPSGTTCNGAYSGTFKGSLSVSKGQNCVFIGGGTSGSITETGGNLVLNGATVGSSVTITTGGAFTIGPSTTIKGSLTIQSLTKSTATNQVCGATISGSLVVQTSSAAVLIGSGTPSCAGNIVKGSLQVASNPAPVTMDGNKVSGSVQVQSNSGATTIDGNTVGVSMQVQSNRGATQIFTNVIANALQCQSNSSITGGGNTAPTKQGQCAKF